VIKDVQKSHLENDCALLHSKIRRAAVPNVYILVNMFVDRHRVERYKVWPSRSQHGPEGLLYLWRYIGTTVEAIKHEFAAPRWRHLDVQSNRKLCALFTLP